MSSSPVSGPSEYPRRVIDADAVMIDLYDTLAWTEWPRLRDLMCARIGVDAGTLLRAFDETRPQRGQGSYAGAEEDWASVLGATRVDPEPGLIADLLALERDFLVDGVHLYEDSLPVVRELRSRDVRTALVSNCSRSTRPVVDRLGLEEEFDAVVLSFEVGALKPNAEIYREALRRLGDVPPGSAVFVDDQARYCEGAQAVGIDARLIARDGAAPFEGLVIDRPSIRDLRQPLS